MQNLFRRPSGIYVLRIAVPAQLRPVFGKREVVATTGTRELTIAKIVAGAQAAQWRQRFFDAGRLMSLASTSTMDHQEILKIAQGHPVLLGGGHLTLPHSSTASGISTTDLLRAAASGHLSLFVRAGNIRGHLIRLDDLDLDDPEMGRAGGYVVPCGASTPSKNPIGAVIGPPMRPGEHPMRSGEAEGADGFSAPLPCDSRLTRQRSGDLCSEGC